LGNAHATSGFYCSTSVRSGSQLASMVDAVKCTLSILISRSWGNADLCCQPLLVVSLQWLKKGIQEVMTLNHRPHACEIARVQSGLLCHRIFDNCKMILVPVYGSSFRRNIEISIVTPGENTVSLACSDAYSPRSYSGYLGRAVQIRSHLIQGEISTGALPSTLV